MNAAPDTDTDTDVLVHGLRMIPRSWDGWVARYEAKGMRVLTPAYPDVDVDVEVLRETPDVGANLTVTDTVDHLASVVESDGHASGHRGPLVRRNAHSAAPRERSRVAHKDDDTRPPACRVVDLPDCPSGAAAVTTPAAAITPPAASTLLETVQSIGDARVTVRFSDLEP